MSSKSEKKSGPILYSTPQAERSPAELIDDDQGSVQRRVAERAHQKFMARGGEHGHHEEDWICAEQEIANEVREPHTDSFRGDPSLPEHRDDVQVR